MLRIVLIDDEEIVLRGMAHLLKKYYPDHRLLGAFDDGYAALDYIKQTNNVDIVITDIRMPRISGTELIKKIKDVNNNIFVIALSAYSDYDLVRHAMLNGAYDYLLKPCKPGDICTLLSKVHGIKIHEDNEKYDLFYKEQIQHLISGNAPREKIFNDGDLIMLILFSPIDAFDGHIYDMIIKNLSVLLPNKSLCIRCQKYILSVIKNPSNHTEMYKPIQDYIDNMWYKRIKISCSITSFKYTNTSFYKEFQFLQTMAEFAEFNKCNLIFTRETYIRYIKRQEKYAFTDYFNVNTALRLIMDDNPNKLNSYVNHVVDELYKLSLYFDPIRIKKEITHELLKIDGNLCANYSIPSQKLEYNYNIIENINSSSNFDMLCANFKQTIYQMFLFYKQIKGKPKYIINAIAYIELNYMNDISLKDVADHVFLNPWYFSSRFKEYMGISMNKYVNNVRINIAKELLKQQDLMIYEVAEMVGYSDPTYFSSVFKQIEKITPQQYRKLC